MINYSDNRKCINSCGIATHWCERCGVLFCKECAKSPLGISGCGMCWFNDYFKDATNRAKIVPISKNVEWAYG